MRLPDGARVDLTKRALGQRLLLTLARARIATPGRPVSRNELVCEGWPDQPLAPRVASGRLRVALHALRGLGLDRILLTGEHGWQLSPDVPVVLLSRPPTID